VERKLIFDEISLKLFAEKLKQVRKEKGFTQEELAFCAELALSQIARIETFKINPTLSTIFAIARALKIRPSVLFDFDIPTLEE
jgi:transcriptional regulator with XRE-family HTH domain